MPAEQLKTVDYWSDRAALGELRAVLDPLDEAGAKNEFLTAVHSVGLRHAAKRCGSRRHGTAVDYGCGIGRLTPALLELADEVIGVDPVQHMLERARSTYTSARVRFLVPDELPETLMQPLLFVCVGVMAENMRREEAVDVLRRFRQLAGEGSHCIVMERVVRAPGCVPADIEPRDVDWYAGVLAEAGWLPLGTRAMRRAWSRPQALSARLAPRLPRAARRLVVAACARVEFAGAPRAREGDYVDGSMWGEPG